MRGKLNLKEEETQVSRAEEAIILGLFTCRLQLFMLSFARFFLRTVKDS